MNEEQKLASCLAVHVMDTLPTSIESRIRLLDALARFLPEPIATKASCCASTLRAAEAQQMQFAGFLKAEEDDGRFP